MKAAVLSRQDYPLPEPQLPVKTLRIYCLVRLPTAHTMLYSAHSMCKKFFDHQQQQLQKSCNSSLGRAATRLLYSSH